MERKLKLTSDRGVIEMSFSYCLTSHTGALSFVPFVEEGFEWLAEERGVVGSTATLVTWIFFSGFHLVAENERHGYKG